MRNNPTSPELLKKYPHLVPRELFPNMSCAALAAKNQSLVKIYNQLAIDPGEVATNC